MRLMLWRFVTPTWEAVAPEVAVSSVRGIRTLPDILGQSGHAIYHDLLIRHRLWVAWTGGPVVEHIVVAGSISSGGDHGVHCWWDLIRSKQLVSAPYVAWRCMSDFLVMVILWYIYMLIFILFCSYLIFETFSKTSIRLYQCLSASFYFSQSVWSNNMFIHASKYI